MIGSLRRKARVYLAMMAMMPKLMMAYSIWFWVEFFGQIMMMIIFVFFWRAVYAETDTVGGLTAAQTITYILYAQMIAPLVRWSLVLDFGGMIREGQVGIELLRPMDFQGRFYAQGLAAIGVILLRQTLPLGLVAWLLFGLRIPTDPRVWLAFFVSLLMGNAILFFFDWTFATLAFYTTETWGLHVLREGVAVFFSGALLPLAMMPLWLQQIAAALPFSQTLYVPVGLLTGLIPIERMLHVWLVQVAWLGGLYLLSRLIFRVAVRRITVQGG